MQRVFLITGATRGIGRAIADAIYKANSNHLLSLGVRGQKTDLTDNWESSRFIVQHYDAMDNTSADNWIEATMKTFGHIDGIINCAGVLESCDVQNYSDEVMDRVFAINVKAPIYLIHKSWEQLKQSGSSRIINLISLAGKRTITTSFAYSASKHAFLAANHGIRQAGWQYGIRTTAICPGWVNTDMTKEYCSLDLSTITQPEDIAKLVITIINLPNTASISEVPINGQFDCQF